MKRTIHIFIVALLMAAFDLSAQPGVFQPGDYRDGIYDKENANSRRFIPYTHLREADVVWEKRVWRDIDMREKINQPLYYPITYEAGNGGRMSLFMVLKDYITKGKLLAFADEDFLIPMELFQAKEKFVQCDSSKQSNFDAEGNEIITSVWTCDSVSVMRDILRYRLKEDWFFDKQKSVLEVRIIGIGVFKYDEAKDGYKDLFYVYFPSCRPYFAKHEVYNVKNDSERRTFEDVFWKRQFSSKIIKETNVFGRQIDEYSKGIDALLESDRVKQDIFQWEHDLWHF